MTNAGFIDKIKAEIERLQDKHHSFMVDCYVKDLLSSISTLESEKPINTDELEKEIEQYLLGNADFLIKEGSKNVVQAIARHFYDLGCRRTAEKYDEIEYNRQKAEESVPNDLEEAAREFAKDAYPDKHNLVWMFKRGAKWQKEQDEKEQADLFTIVALDAAQRAKEQMMENYPKWRRIKAGERLPCPAYVWTIAYDNYPDCFEGRLMPNIQGVKVGRDTWYLPVDVIHNLPKED